MQGMGWPGRAGLGVAKLAMWTPGDTQRGEAAQDVRCSVAGLQTGSIQEAPG